MRALGACAFATVAIGCSAGAGDSRSRPTTPPSLTIVRATPLTVRGRGFEPHESVTVRAGSESRSARANGNGTFVVVLGSQDRCNSVRVLATRSRGSTIVLKVLPSPECAVQRSR